MIKKLLLVSVLSVSSVGYASDSTRALQDHVFRSGLKKDEVHLVQEKQAEATFQEYITIVNQAASQANYKKQIEALDFLIKNYDKIPNLQSKIGKTRPQLEKQLSRLEFNPNLTLTAAEKTRFKDARHSKK